MLSQPWWFFAGPVQRRTCKVCEKTFNTQSAVNVHMRIHTGKVLPWTIYGSTNKPEIPSVGVYKVRTCTFKHSFCFPGEKPYKCKDCGRAFRQQGDLKYHMKRHVDIKEFQCEFCGKEFARRYSLHLHTKIHTGIRDYVCDTCGKSFRAAIYLKAHKRIHTGMQIIAADILYIFVPRAIPN